MASAETRVPGAADKLLRQGGEMRKGYRMGHSFNVKVGMYHHGCWQMLG